MRLILFVCTGNYYRSRFAEYYFNHISRDQSLQCKAYSKGLEVYRHKNKGALSKNVYEYMNNLSIPIDKRPRFPFQLNQDDLDFYDRMIFMDKDEHETMLQRYFPEKTDKVEFWDHPDDYLVEPGIVLPKIKERVKSLIEEISK